MDKPVHHMTRAEYADSGRHVPPEPASVDVFPKRQGWGAILTYSPKPGSRFKEFNSSAKSREEAAADALAQWRAFHGPDESHRAAVKGALERNEHVPPEVLADYPDIVADRAKEYVDVTDRPFDTGARDARAARDEAAAARYREIDKRHDA